MIDLGPRTPAAVFWSGLVFLGLVWPAAATAQGRAALTQVHLAEATPDGCRMVLATSGPVGRVDTMSLSGGRFVFDLVQVAWDGPVRRVNPQTSGVREYRFSQLSRDPLITRFVVEVSAGWSCRHEAAPGGLQVLCGGPSVVAQPRHRADISDIAVTRGIGLTSPVAGFDAGELIRRSLEFVPEDMVRDGLPYFGAVRDDWQGAPRPHKGIDIYGDKLVIKASAAGEVVGAGLGQRAGGWIKIDHGDGVETVYVHVARLTIRSGDRVEKGQPIAIVDGPKGNAIQAQLHFEVRLDGVSVDLVPYIYQRASQDLRARIDQAKQRLDALTRQRAIRVERGDF